MHGYSETMKLAKYLALPEDEKREYEDKMYEGMSTPPELTTLKFSKEIRRYSPDLPCLYRRIAFPNFQNKEGTFRCILDEDDILNGTIEEFDEKKNLLSTDPKVIVSIMWCGYASFLKDGQLKLGQKRDNAKIHIVINGSVTKFEGMKLIEGKWPEFLCLFHF